MNVRVVPMVAIGDLVESVQTWNPATKPDKAFLYVDLSAVSQTDKRIIAATLTLGSEAPSRARQLIQAGDVLVSTVRPNLNGVAPVTNDFDGATASTGFCVLRPRTQKLATEYLMHWVRSPLFVDQMTQQATGASYPAVSDRVVKASAIPLPPLNEQRRIAAILDKADALRWKRKRALGLLDGLTQSIFLEMFGSPGSANFRLPQKRLGDIAELINGDRSSNYPSGSDLVSDGVLFLNTTNILPDGLDLSQANFITEEKFKSLSRGKLKRRDIVITLRGSLGQSALFDCWADTAFINAQMMIIRSRPGVDPIYLLQALQLDQTKEHLKAIGSGSAVPQLTAKQMSDLQIAMPSTDEQAVFASKRQECTSARLRLKNAVAGAESLLASLQHRAFSGTL